MKNIIVLLLKHYNTHYVYSKCYNTLVKFIREFEDIIAATCTCTAGSSVNHASAIRFVLEVFSRTNLKTL